MCVFLNLRVSFVSDYSVINLGRPDEVLVADIGVPLERQDAAVVGEFQRAAPVLEVVALSLSTAPFEPWAYSQESTTCCQDEQWELCSPIRLAITPIAGTRTTRAYRYVVDATSSLPPFPAVVSVYTLSARLRQ